MRSGNEVAVLADDVERCLAHTSHDAHVDHDVGRVGDFDAELRDARTQRAHRERNDIHRATTHRAREQTVQRAAHLCGISPVVGRAGILGILRADVGAILDASDIAGARASEEGVRADLRVQANERAGGDHLLGEAIPFGLRPIAPDNLIGLCEFDHLGHPGQQLGVLGGCVFQTSDH